MGLESFRKGKKMRRPLSSLPSDVRDAVLHADERHEALVAMQRKATESRLRNLATRTAKASIEMSHDTAEKEYWDERSREKAVADEEVRRKSANEHILPTNPEDQEEGRAT